MSVFQKIKWFVAVLGVFLIILMTNLLDKQNFLRVEEVVENIFNDRLLAKELLFDVSTKFHQKELAYALNDTVYLETQNDKINTEITQLLTMFDRTNQTRGEKTILASLRDNHAELMRLERNAQLNDSLYNQVYSVVFSSIANDVRALSAEQVEEGKLQTMHAKDAVDVANLFSKIEIYILIFLGLVIQFIILYSPKNKSTD